MVIMLILSSTSVVAYKVLDLYWLKIPWLPISLVGIAVAFFIGFKNNSSYGRLWEARQIWGAIVNNSRTWGIMVKDFVTTQFQPDGSGEEDLLYLHQELMYRHIAWLTALRHQLRTPRSWEHRGNARGAERVRKNIREYNVSLEEDLHHLISNQERQEILKNQNPATQLIARQSAQLRALRASHFIDDFRHMEMQRMLGDLYTQQGKCERIKNFPFPRQYATFTLISIWIFAILLPFGLISTFEGAGEDFVWLTIPSPRLPAGCFLRWT